jgi:hypothetical protein
VYWSDDYDISSQPLSGGSPMLITKAGFVSALAASGGRVYWTSNDGCEDFPGVFTCPANAACTPQVYDPDPAAAGLVVDATSGMLYWTNQDPGTVRKCALGAICSAPVTIASAFLSPTVVAVDAKNAFFLANDTSNNILVYEVAK